MSDVKIKVTSDGREVQSDMKKTEDSIKKVEGATKSLSTSAQRMSELIKQSGGNLAQAAARAAAEINKDVVALKLMEAQVDKTNKEAVSSLRETVSAQLEYTKSINGSVVAIVDLNEMVNRLDQNLRNMNTPKGRAEAGKEQEIIQRKQMAMSRLHDEAIRMNQRFEEQSGHVDKVNTRYRTATMAASRLSFAMTGMGSSAAGSMESIGMLADSVAQLSGNARVAASAAGLGALAVALGAGMVLWDGYQQKVQKANLAIIDAKRESAELTAQLADHQLLAARLDITGSIAKQIEEVEKEFKGSFIEKLFLGVMASQGMVIIPDREIKKFELINALTKQRNEAIELMERNASREAERETMSMSNATEVGRLALLNEIAAKKLDINLKTELELDKLKDLKLTDDERLLREQALNNARKLGIDLIDLEKKKKDQQAVLGALSGSDNFRVATEARIVLLELERDAYIVATGDKLRAEEIYAEKRKQLGKDVFRAHMQSLNDLMSVTSNSNNQNTKAIHNFIKNIRGIELGYEAAKATIASFREGAAAVAAAATGNMGSAALHAVAAVKYAATAAIAAQEAGGRSAGGGSAGGGAGGGGLGGPTSQQESTRLGANMGIGQGQTLKIEFVYIEKDASGKTTRRIAHDLERLKDLNMPVRLTV